MEGTKLYTCFETTNDQGQHLYMIYSAKVRKLIGNAADSKPTFILESVISGFPSMGCGVFGSKIVLAGGVWGKRKERSYNLQLITYDTVTKHVSRKDLPPLRGRKFRPLVFELYGRLYVLDTSKSLYPWSFEIYYPTRKFWHPLFDPFSNRFTEAIGKKKISGRAPYAWFVVGKVLCISVPTDNSLFLHHAKQLCKNFQPNSFQSLPFHGMAITYWQPGFDDVVVISFSKGCVEGRRLNFCFPDIKIFGKPKPLFDTDPYEQPDGELSGYFAECGDGVFCLTTFDNMNMHVYMFKIHRHPEQGDGLNLVLIYRVKHKFSFNDFSFEGSKGVNIPGCFVLPRADQTKRLEEAKLYHHRFTICEDEREGLDVPLCRKTRNGSIRSRINLETDNRKTESTDSSDCESYLDADSSDSNVWLGRRPSIEDPEIVTTVLKNMVGKEITATIDVIESKNEPDEFAYYAVDMYASPLAIASTSESWESHDSALENLRSELGVQNAALVTKLAQLESDLAQIKAEVVGAFEEGYVAAMERFAKKGVDVSNDDFLSYCQGLVPGAAGDGSSKV